MPRASAFKTSAGAAQGAGVRAGAEAGAIPILQRNGQALGLTGNGNGNGAGLVLAKTQGIAGREPLWSRSPVPADASGASDFVGQQKPSGG